MMRRLAGTAVAIGLAALMAGGLYWAFLNTPESRALMLAASALLLVAIAVVISVAGTTALLFARGGAFGRSVRRGLSSAHWFFVAMLVGAGLIWLVLRADLWIAEHSGQISAWFIATLNWADVRWLFRVESWLSEWLRWVVIPSVMLAAVTGISERGLGPREPLGSLRAALNWRTLAMTTAAYVVLIALPWRYVTWAPRGLTGPSMELAFVATRAVIISAALTIGAAIIVTSVARAGRDRRD